jgi:hypothetical protein
MTLPGHAVPAEGHIVTDLASRAPDKGEPADQAGPRRNRSAAPQPRRQARPGKYGATERPPGTTCGGLSAVMEDVCESGLA